METPSPSVPNEFRERLARALGPGYELRELLGRGGFGDVFLAWDVRLKREIAVKALRADLIVTGGLLERFRREAEAAARLRHSNIVPIYAVGEDEGVAWFTMPLVKGESLRAVMERSGPMPIAEARRVLREAAAALAAAHDAGIVHRDIKPDNIMLEGPERRVLLMDFGIAKAMAATDGALTGTGFIVGTPQYMSPEQAAGARDLDRRSDLYSLGVVAYHMLAGRPLFDAATPQALIVDHIATPPRPIEQLRPDLPPALAQAVMRSLEKKPEQRWDSAADLLAALEPDALPSPTMATVPIVRGEGASVRRGWPRAATVALGSAVVVILAVMFGRPLVQRAAGAGTTLASVAVLYFASQSGDDDDYLAQGLTDEITSRLGSIERLRVKSLSAVRRLQVGGETDPTVLGHALGVEYLVEGTVRRAGPLVRVTFALVKAADGFRVAHGTLDDSTMNILVLQEQIASHVALSIRGRLLPEEQASLRSRPTLSAEAYDHFLRANHHLGKRGPGALTLAIREYEQAVRLDPTFRQALARVSLSYALALWWGWEIGGQPPDSLLARGLTATSMILARDSGVADAWTAYALMLTFRHPRTYEGAEAAFQRALALDSANAETWQQYAWLLQTTGRDDAAAAAYRRALAIDPDRPVTWSALGWLYYYLLRRYPEALAATDSGLALDSTAYWLYPPRTRTLLVLCDTAGALRAAEAALRFSPPDYTLHGEAAMALAEAALGRRREARARIQRMRRQMTDPRQPTFLETHYLAEVLIQTGDREGALALIENARPRGANLWFVLRFPPFDAIRNDPRFQRVVRDSRPPGVRE